MFYGGGGNKGYFGRRVKLSISGDAVDWYGVNIGLLSIVTVAQTF